MPGPPRTAPADASARSARVVQAAWAIAGPGPDGRVEPLEAGGVLVRGGRVVRLLGSRRAVLRAARAEGTRPVEVDGVLLTGLVNAHAHLELSHLAGRIAPGGDFVSWVGRVVGALASATRARRVAAVREGALRCLETGTTTVGDIDSSGLVAEALPLRRVVFREVLDARDSGRTSEALRGVRRALPARTLRSEGISPHGPHTVGAELAREAARLARSRRLPVSIHWAESEEEVRFLREGTGPFASWLGPSPHRNGLALLAEAGLLGCRTSLVHGNHPAPGDAALLARSRCTLVHCPGSHAWFGRAPFRHRTFTRAGVPIALGSDSLASNEDLDLRREMGLYRRSRPRLPAGSVLAASTVLAARALGLSRVGSLAPGFEADLVVHRFTSRGPRDFLEELTHGGGEVCEVWVRGRRCLRRDPQAPSLGFPPELT